MTGNKGVVYTETVIHAAPAAFAADAPYQVAIVELEGGSKVTARIVGERVTIGDQVVDETGASSFPVYRRAS